MKRYARVRDGIVVELFETDLDIATLFSADLVWVAIEDAAPVREGWRYVSGTFSAPVQTAGDAAPAPTLADLQAEFQRLAAQLAALTPRS